jgi:hypothetical protein
MCSVHSWVTDTSRVRAAHYPTRVCELVRRHARTLITSVSPYRIPGCSMLKEIVLGTIRSLGGTGMASSSVTLVALSARPPGPRQPWDHPSASSSPVLRSRTRQCC